MSVDRKPADRFSSDREQAQRSLRYQAEFILANLHHLRNVDRRGRMETAAKEFADKLTADEDLTPGQRSYLEAIFEKTHEGAGFPAARTHHDVGRKGLRFG